jgi:DnaJ-class molecular chaperone
VGLAADTAEPVRSRGGWSDADFGDIFNSVFGEGRQTGDDRRSHGRDEQYALSTTFLEAVNGATRRLTLPDGRTLEVKIPPGTVEGRVLRLRGVGGPSRNGPPAGDALIEVHVDEHRHFHRDGQDIRLALPVTLSEAGLGGPR